MKQKKLDAMRHSLSHLMSMAIMEKYPTAGLGVGPSIENGFYQDYDLPESISEKDFVWIEKRMREMIAAKIKFSQSEVNFEEALKFYKHDPYKTEMVNGLKATGEKKLSFYDSDWFHNLCAGPHVKDTSEINPDAFKLMSVAGAYWRGSEKNKMLTRIYGVAFETKEGLAAYLNMLAEAEKRDHRKIGQELDLFHIDSLVGLGLPLWHPKGAMLWRIIEDFWYKEHLRFGYSLVRSPHIGNKRLWETSGHWGFYNDSMYPPLEVGQSLREAQDKEKLFDSEQYLLKPMNCPFHIQIYKHTLRSYRELPFRWAECGTVYRFEKKGELSGLTRVRGFTQDDAHIICRAEQVEDELKRVVDFILHIFNSFGFKTSDLCVYLSVRDSQNTKYAGNDEGWAFTEKVLEKVAKEKKLHYDKDVGGAVFYGPKLDFKIKDALGREWQCSTLQFDFNLPSRFDMTFTNQKGEAERPYVLHRALFGSYERFIGLLLEHYAGDLPLWLAPTQLAILPVSEKFIDHSEKLAEQLREAGYRVEVNVSDESLGKKIRQTETEKINYAVILGEKEVKLKKVSLRKRKEGDLGQMSVKKLLERLEKGTKLKT